MAGTVHIVGAGLGGLSAAVDLADAGYKDIRFYEAAKAAGGRCRSFVDTVLNIVVDNGSHLLLSGNWAAVRYLKKIDGLKEMTQCEAEIPFADLASGERWTLRPNSSRVPWWILDNKRRVPGSKPTDYLAPLGLLRAINQSRLVGEVMDTTTPLYERLWRPVMLAALNVEPAEADAQMAITLFKETFGAGGAACKPIIAHQGMSSAYIDPAIKYLEARGASFAYGRTLRGVEYDGQRASVLDFGDEKIIVAADDIVILAAPPVVARSYVPGLITPEKFKAIVNVHFKIAPPQGHPMYLGVVNSITEWLFSYEDHMSVTISAADEWMHHDREDLARKVWAEVSKISGLPEALPPWQINRERRATFAAIPSEAKKRPGVKTQFNNLFLAGDWTATGLPACMEGAVRSGNAAASAILETAQAAAGAAA
jgi:hydroxysqualene dehydroxylase